jgi:hypothetical protein
MEVLTDQEPLDENRLLGRRLLREKGYMLRSAEDPELEKRRLDLYVHHLSRVGLNPDGSFYFRRPPEPGEQEPAKTGNWEAFRQPMDPGEVADLVVTAESLNEQAGFGA